MLAEALSEAALTAVANRVARQVEKAVSERSIPKEARLKRSDPAVLDQLILLSRWSADISLRDFARSRSLRSSFVELDLRLGRRDSGDDVLGISDLLTRPEHFVILGDPGAGKTTTLKRVAAEALQMIAREPTAPVPLLVRLRSLGPDDSLADVVQTALGVSLEFAESRRQARESRRRHTMQATLRAFVSNIFERMPFLLLVDGLDELHPAARPGVIEDLRHFMLRLEKSRVILTCRAADYRVSLDKSQVLFVRPLSVAQVHEFADKWLGQERAQEFLAQVATNPYAGTEIRPLTLAHLCAIYERSGTVPDRPKTVYKKIVRLLLEEWDEQRSVRRHTKYAGFEIDRKEEFLEAVAYRLSVIHQQSAFSEAELVGIYREIHVEFGLPANDALSVAREIESHTGLIVESDEDSFEFAHKSLQEYLTASYLLKLPSIPADDSVRLPHEMAVAVALSSDQTRYLESVLQGVLARERDELDKFTEPFLMRLQTEKVVLTQSIRLGALLLALYGETYSPPAGPIGRPKVDLSILNQDAVAQSLSLAFRKSAKAKTPEGYLVRIPHSLVQIAVFRSDRVQGHIEITVGHRILDQVGAIRKRR